MDLSFTPEQTAFRLKAREAIASILPEDWGGTYNGPMNEDDNAVLQRAWDGRLNKLGLRGVNWPKAYGGQGMTLIDHFIVSEELGRVAAPEGINTVGTELVGPLLLVSGTEEQRQRFIPKILSSEEVWCQGFSEPNAGSDLASLKTSAVRDGDEWVINGQKVWTSNAFHSEWCILLARTDPSLPKHKGISLLLVPMKTPGIIVRPLGMITGRNYFNEIFFENVRVPVASMIGGVNEGWRISNEVLSIERGTNRLFKQARFVHEMQHLLQIFLASPRVKDGALRSQIASVYAELAIFRYHQIKLISRSMADEKIGAEVSINKLFWSEMHQKLANLGLSILGSEAMLDGEDAVASGRFQELWMQSRAETIYAGTSQVQRNIIAERVLGLPR